MERLEDRTLLSATLTGFSLRSGEWKIGTFENGALEVATVAHWEAYGLKAVVHGDFNADGHDDVAGWYANGHWRVGLGTPDGGMETEIWYVRPNRDNTWTTIQAGDFNGDGKTDVAMFSRSGAWWVGISDGSQFQMEKWHPPGEWHVGAAWRTWQVADFDGDGKDDVAGLTNGGRWQVGLSTGASFVQETWLPSRGWPRRASLKGVVVGDFNADGKADIAGVRSDRTVIVAISDGSQFTSSVWGTFPNLKSKLKMLHTGDFDGNGFNDIVALDGKNNTWVFYSDGDSFTGGLIAAQSRFAGKPLALNTGDFDGDGVPEVAVLTDKGWWNVAEITPGRVAYTPLAKFGAGKWAGTFVSESAEPDYRVNRIRAFRKRPRAYIITQQDLARIRKDPAFFATVFESYKFSVRKRLGKAYAGISDQGLAFALATMVTYQHAPYRAPNDAQGHFPRPKSFKVDDLLDTRKLICNETCYLAFQLYRIAFAKADDPGTTLQMAGFHTGPFGNHAQWLFSDDTITMLGDPTLGLVAQTSLPRLLRGMPVPAYAIRQPILRVEVTPAIQENLVKFRFLVVNALKQGLYPQTTRQYLFSESDIRDRAPA